VGIEEKEKNEVRVTISGDSVNPLLLKKLVINKKKAILNSEIA